LPLSIDACIPSYPDNGHFEYQVAGRSEVHLNRETRNFGKIDSSFLERIIYPKLGAVRPEVVAGPATGVDTSVIKIGSNQVLVATCDPISLIPELGPEDSAWMSVNLIANDLSTSGLTPQYMLIDLNLPPEMSDELLEQYWNSLSQECLRLGIAVVGGHTGKFEGCDYTIIGSGTAFSTGSRSRCVVSSGGHLGDSVILTKGAAISATGILARAFPDKVRQALGESLLKRAADHFRLISASADAQTAVAFGTGVSGVSAMHDVTEGGVLSALYELAYASSLGVVINKNRIEVSPETKAICELFSLDPYITLGEGALVIACSSNKSAEIVEALRSNGTRCSIVGELVDSGQGVKVVDEGREIQIQGVSVDPYWAAYYSAAAANLT
jgi:hydrogenase expression/formation protein HypE